MDLHLGREKRGFALKNKYRSHHGERAGREEGKQGEKIKRTLFHATWTSLRK